MKALVTGYHGFVGFHLARLLLKRKIIAVSLPREYLMRPKDLKIFLETTNPDYIFHLAAYGNMSTQTDEEEAVTANIMGAWNLLQASKDIAYKSFINVSSSSVLLDHQTIYSATKMGAEYLCRAFVDEYDKPIVTIRPFSVYGEHEANFRFIPTVFRSCMKGEPMVLAPDAVHDWVYVDDVVNAMLEMAADVDNQKGQAINVGTGVATTNEVVVAMIEEITGKKAQITERKELRSFDNTEWVAKDSDYIGTTKLFDGLTKYYHWYTGKV